MGMKKVLTVIALLGLLGTAFLTPASAGWWGRGAEKGCGAGPGAGCGKGPCASRDNDGSLDKARQELMSQSQELRQQLHGKKGLYRDLMQQDAPNKEEAAKLWGEIFDLQTKLQQMASTSGITPGKGPGNTPCGGPCAGGSAVDDQDEPGGFAGRGGCGRGCRGPQ